LDRSHFVELIPLDAPLKREFYAQMCRFERWRVRTLREKVHGMLLERTTLSHKPAALVGRELAALPAKRNPSGTRSVDMDPAQARAAVSQERPSADDT
jgi:predicted nuclease of restriction endonuclease-like (RecB) superfamily